MLFGFWFARSFPFPVVHFTLFPQKCCNKSADIYGSKFLHSHTSIISSSLHSDFLCLARRKCKFWNPRVSHGMNFHFSHQGSPTACLHPDTQAYTLAREEPRTVSAVPFQQPTRIHFWWRALNCKTCELKVKITHTRGRPSQDTSLRTTAAFCRAQQMLWLLLHPKGWETAFFLSITLELKWI